MSAVRLLSWLGLLLLGTIACGEAEEADRFEVEVVSDPGGLGPVVTDLGYTVTLHEARAVLGSLTFEIADEAHARGQGGIWLQRTGRLLVPTAHAHPGHHHAGVVGGELRGRYVVDWMAPPTRLGVATLIAGTYAHASFRYHVAESTDVGEDDDLVGRTVLLRGTAVRDGDTVEFTMGPRVAEGAALEGASMRWVAKKGDRLGLRLVLEAPQGRGTLFDGIDFLELAAAGGGSPQVEEAVVRLGQAFLDHDFFEVRALPGGR